MATSVLMRPVAVLTGLVLLAGCTTVRPLARAAPEAALQALGDEVSGREVQVGVARREGSTLIAYDVTSQPARDLQLFPDRATWSDPRDGRTREVPLEALSWVRWSDPGKPRLRSALTLGGLGLLGGAALGTALAFVFGYRPDTCVGGVNPPEFGVTTFGQRCFAAWLPGLGLGAAIGAVAGGALGAILGLVLGERTQVELQGVPAAPAPTAAPPP